MYLFFCLRLSEFPYDVSYMSCAHTVHYNSSSNIATSPMRTYTGVFRKYGLSHFGIEIIRIMFGHGSQIANFPWLLRKFQRPQFQILWFGHGTGRNSEKIMIHRSVNLDFGAEIFTQQAQWRRIIPPNWEKGVSGAQLHHTALRTATIHNSALV